MRSATLLTACAAVALAGCQSAAPDVARLIEPEPIRTHGTPPPGAAPDACFGVDATPAVVETVTEPVLLQPAEVASDGSVLFPPVHKTEAREAIVEERRELWFETPCEDDLTPDFVASLQRALKVRGLYGGPVNGEMTAWTRHGVRTYQKPQGLDSGILSIAAARQLGLVAYDRDPAPEPESTSATVTGPDAGRPADPETGLPQPVDPAVLWRGAPAPDTPPETAGPALSAASPAPPSDGLPQPVDPSVLWQLEAQMSGMTADPAGGG